MNHLVTITVMPKWYLKPSMAGTHGMDVCCFQVRHHRALWLGFVSVWWPVMFYGSESYGIHHHEQAPFFGYVFFWNLFQASKHQTVANPRWKRGPSISPIWFPRANILRETKRQDEKVWWIPPWRQRRRDICNGGWWRPWKICPWSTRLGTWKCRDSVVEVPKLSWLHIDRVIGLPNHFP